MTIPGEEELTLYRSRPRPHANRSTNSAWDQIRRASEEFVSRAGNPFIVPDIGRIDHGTKGRIVSRHAGTGRPRANANPETLCRKYAGTLRSFETGV